VLAVGVLALLSLDDEAGLLSFAELPESDFESDFESAFESDFDPESPPDDPLSDDPLSGELLFDA
jgi:hypothetical protein